MITETSDPEFPLSTLVVYSLFTISTFPKIHLVCPPKNLHNLCFPFPPGITVVPRETEDNASAKVWGGNKVYYGGCGNYEFLGFT